MQFFGRSSVSISIVILLSVIVTSTFTSTTSNEDENSFQLIVNTTFACKNGQEISLTKHNNGIDDCGDNSDEYDDPLLFYTTYQDNIARGNGSSDEFSITGTFLENEVAFQTSSNISSETCGKGQILVLFGSHGPYLYLMCEGRNDSIYRMSRNHTDLKKISFLDKNITSFVFDLNTSNVYLLANKRIEICDSEFNFCSTLRGQMRKKPTSLTFSSGSLFWIEENFNKTTRSTRWFIVKSQRDGSQVKVIFVSKNALEFVTVDQSYQRLYWFERTNEYGSRNIYSSTFNGSDVQLSLSYEKWKIIRSNNVDDFVSHKRALLIIEDVVSVDTFAVDRGQLFWADAFKKEIRKCIIDDDGDCSSNSSSRVLDKYQRIGKRIIIHSEHIVKEKLLEEHACLKKPCSHLCTYTSINTHTCFCPNSYDGKPLNANNGFCEGMTAISIRGNNSLYILTNSSSTNDSSLANWRAREITLENINSSISAITYDSIQGRVIFAENGNETIYSWTFGEKPKLLISQEGEGTIRALEFDDWGNSIFWISSSNGTIKVRSFVTNQTTTILPKNSSAEPLLLTLAPITGSIYTLLKTVNNSIDLERVPMNDDKGKPIGTRQLLHHFPYSNISYLSLHYMKEENILLLTDRLENKTRYTELGKFNGTGEMKFLQLVNKDNATGNFYHVSTLDESVFMTEADLPLQCYSTEEATLRRTGEDTWKYVAASAGPTKPTANHTSKYRKYGGLLLAAPLLYPILRSRFTPFTTTTPTPPLWNNLNLVESLSDASETLTKKAKDKKKKNKDKKKDKKNKDKKEKVDLWYVGPKISPDSKTTNFDSFSQKTPPSIGFVTDKSQSQKTPPPIGFVTHQSQAPKTPPPIGFITNSYTTFKPHQVSTHQPTTARRTTIKVRTTKRKHSG